MGLAEGLRRGYATAATGHRTRRRKRELRVGSPGKVDRTSLIGPSRNDGKIEGHHRCLLRRPSKYSYWNGCSSGGKQGLKEAQKFPNDFDGIIAGAPANYWTHLTAARRMGRPGGEQNEAQLYSACEVSAHSRGGYQCLRRLGRREGQLIDDPRKCKFDPKVLQCTGDDGSDLLTAAQVETARANLFTRYEPADETSGPSWLGAGQRTGLGA